MKAFSFLLTFLTTLLATTLSIFSLTANADTARIVGGVKSAYGAWPAMVSLLDKRLLDQALAGALFYNDGSVIPASEANYIAHTCGGTLIAPNWVLTAAHCVVSAETGAIKAPNTLLILQGVNNLAGGSGVWTAVKRIIPHPNYRLHVTGSFDSDIALLELSSASNMPIITPSALDAPAGIATIATGWGRTMPTNPNDYGSRFLREVVIPVTNRATCQAVHANAFTENMLCAGFVQGGRGTCQGDSGGPLIGQLASGQYVQIGITSWGNPVCNKPGTYAVFTRVSKFIPWINTYISEPTPTKPPDSSNSGGGSMGLWFMSLVLVPLLRRRLNKKGNSS